MPTLYIRNVPEDLHKAVKVGAAQAGMSIQDFVLHTMHKELDMLSYYAAEFDGVIYGIGTSEDGAMGDALNGAGYRTVEDLEADGNTVFTIIPMTKAYYLHVLDRGFDGKTDSYCLNAEGLADFCADE